MARLTRGPWLVAAFASGIGVWFSLPSQWEWIAWLVSGCGIAAAGVWAWPKTTHRQMLRVAVISVALAFSAGLALIWARSAMVGAPPITRPMIVSLDGRILERVEQPAQKRVRLVLATRMNATGEAIKIRINIPEKEDRPDLTEGARIRMKARLLPPASPIFPGSYDFARHAWFEGLAATGALLGSIDIIEPGTGNARIKGLQRSLSAHVRSHLDGSAAAIAAAFASGDRGAISKADEKAMRDAGLTHLLSISGLHVSAVIAAVYFGAYRLLALWPWLALRVRLPLVAAIAGALAGLGYTLLTGAQVPTVRSCVGAGLVLLALALGREPLSMRLVAVAAGVVLLLWPESLVGPSFQMSFAAVIAIVALHGSQPVRRFLSPREEGWLLWAARRMAMLFLTGLVIEIVLMPIVLYHFHRSGLYGAFANVLAIPLVTFVAMPLIGLALFLDLIGAGEPVWWLVGKSLRLLLGIAHFTANQPGAVKLVPQIGLGTLLLFAAGGLWMALWRGKIRLWGMAPMILAALAISIARPPDILIGRDGRQVAINGDQGHLLVLRDSKGGYARDTMLEMAARKEQPISLADWPKARCNRDSCVLKVDREHRRWWILMTRSSDLIEWRDLVRACAQADIVVSDRRLPEACHPRWLKADRSYLALNGGLALDLKKPHIDRVAEGQGDHGWWRGRR